MRKVPARLVRKVPRLNNLLQRKIELEIENAQLQLDTTRKAKEIRALKKELSEARKWAFVPHDHFYSPIPNIDEIKKREAKIWGPRKATVANIDLNESGQVKLVRDLKKYYLEQPFSDEKNKKRRFYFVNDFYRYADGLILYSMIRNFKPRRIIEIGSGFSSAVCLDTNELFFNNKIACTFIDPYPQVVNKLIRKNDKQANTFIKNDLQDLDPKIFTKLGINDILLIDSTHVAKTASDVNYIFFEILPRLNPGVLIHFHDIFYPFEYPKEWVFGGHGWNEAYVLRAFLQNNQDYEIVFYTNFMKTFHKKLMSENLPLFNKDDGASIWLRKKA
ncbi:MAG TPA: class I SAM-dependent methyltransferase [Candidatus Saccharimonadales bacterium]|nr:class I SAM-dependent methyltransferase [Candidatus Saccharimonadales bacterium]